MFGTKIEEKSIRNILLIVEIIFVIGAMFSAIKYGNTLLLGSLEKFDNDDVKYIRSAWNLIDNGIISYENIKEPTVYIMPGLTVVLSCFMLVFGKFGGIIAFRFFQVILQGASIYLIFLIGRKVFGSRTAIIACVLDALYVTELFVCNVILMECIFKFLLLLLIILSICAVEKKSLGFYIAGGIVWSIACLFRPTIVVYPLVILIMWIKNKYKPSEIFKYSVVVLGIFCLVMLPWWIRNYREFGMFIPLTRSSGNPFLQGTFINYDQSSGWGVPYIEAKYALEHNQNEINAGLKRLELYGLQQPVRYILWYTVGKTYYFWYSPFYWRRIFNISYRAVSDFHLIILLLGFKNIFSKASKSLYRGFLILIIALFNLIYLPFFTFERYSYPVIPLVIIFAAAELNKMYKRKWKRRDGKVQSTGS
jgi:4-amino-4-deoxy-L-arabinose transferase-like glycosyltransferase